VSTFSRNLTDKGIILSAAPHRETDIRVDFFSQTQGRITCYANGAQRSKKRFMGSLEPTFHIEAVLDRHPSGYTIRECRVHQSYFQMRRSLKHIQSAFYMTYVCQKSLAFGQPNPELFKVLDQGLSALCHDTPLAEILNTFESNYLDVEGIQPERPGRFSQLFESYTGAILPSLSHT
jgi:DNA repair protein RecO